MTAPLDRPPSAPRARETEFADKGTVGTAPTGGLTRLRDLLAQDPLVQEARARRQRKTRRVP